MKPYVNNAALLQDKQVMKVINLKVVCNITFMKFNGGFDF